MGLFSFLTGGAQAKAAKKAARISAEAQAENRALAERFTGESLSDFDTALAGALGETQQYADAGTNALSTLRSFLGMEGPEAAESVLSTLQSSPAYQFGLNQGQTALTRLQNARGQLYSGATGKGLMRFGTDYASGQVGGLMDRINQLAGGGERASALRADALLGTAGSKAATRSNALTPLTAATTGEADARSAGVLGAARARSNALSNILGAVGSAGKFFLGGNLPSGIGQGAAVSRVFNR